MKELSQVLVSEIIKIAPQTYVLQFKSQLQFQAGQIIGITNDPILPPRLYSICSAPDNPIISILFNIKTDGQLTPELAKVKKGECIWITKVQGKFIFNNELAWWIATGTGIAPFYSMFKSGQRPLKLIHGGRISEDFYFQDEFNSLTNYVRCSSQEKALDFYNGRLSEYLVKIDEIPTNINYYLCGSAEMVVDVRNLLIVKGVPFNNIITEIYF